MKSIYAMTAILAFSLLYVQTASADAADGIKIQDIKTLPEQVVAGNPFEINATLVNNSSSPISVGRGACQAPFSVTFDSHVTAKKNNVYCTLQEIEHKINPGEKITATSPYLDLTYVASEAGTVNATVTFQYSVWNQSNQSNVYEKISAPFSFTIRAVTTHDTSVQNETALIPRKFLDFVMPRDTCKPGDNLTISGNTINPANPVTLMLKNPHGKTMETYSAQSDKTGFFSFNLKVPDDAVFGVWNVDVSDGFTTAGKPLTVEYQSPLKQFRSETDAKDTECNPGLDLVIKSEGYTPACVTPDTAQKLIKRGWAKEIVTPPDISSHPTVGVVSIQMIPPYTPGGPTIQMAVKNNGNRPITGLNVILELYNNYTFDFKNVSDLTPLSAGSSVTDTQTLIGGGFDSDTPYHLAISGIADGIPFNFTENIHIPYAPENTAENQTAQLDEFDGVIVDQSITTKHDYSFFTNETSVKFDTGSGGIALDGLDNIDGLDGEHVRLFGTVLPSGEDRIKVEKFQTLGSFVPKGNPPRNMTQQITLDELYNNPGMYYNQTITVMGDLREYDNPVGYAGVGCSSAQFTTSETFAPDFASRRQLYDGQNYIGVRIGGAGDVGYSPTDKLPANLKNKPVTVTGVFVPEIRDTGMCMHVLHESGYILTDFSKIHPVGG